VLSMRGHGKVRYQDGHALCYPWAFFVFARGYYKAQHQERTNAGTASHIPTEDKSTCAKPLRRHIHDIGFVRGGRRTRLRAGGTRDANLRIRISLNKIAERGAGA
jgi:hypothetical protein